MKKLMVLLAAASLFSCATYRPVLDENAKLQKVGSARAEQDIDQCLQKADAYLAGHKNDRMKNSAIRGAGQGAALGGVLGLVSGGNLQSTAGGAILGAGVGAAGGALSETTKDKWKPDELKQRYVKNCLERKQYQVIGWK